MPIRASGKTSMFAATLLMACLFAPRADAASERVVYAFSGASNSKGPIDGHGPSGSLAVLNGTLYGTTISGGNGCRHGVCGIVFAVTPAGAETVLHNFKGGAGDGMEPNGDLLVIGKSLFGTTLFGVGGGVAYKITQAGHETILHAFGGSADGYEPNGGLAHVGGTLYGTTIYGGVSQGCCGTVFSMTPAGTEAVLHEFGATQTEPSGPLASVTYVGGLLYGTVINSGAANSGGGVYSVTPAGEFSLLSSFTGSTNGVLVANEPRASLVKFGGKLYGTTMGGGAIGTCGGNGGCGTAFSVTPKGKWKVLHKFGTGTDAWWPISSLLNVGGTLYGAAYGGGTYNKGAIFTITPAGVESVVYSFAGGSDGELPAGGLIDVGGVLYGVTAGGGSAGCGGGCGTVYAITP